MTFTLPNSLGRGLLTTRGSVTWQLPGSPHSESVPGPPATASQVPSQSKELDTPSFILPDPISLHMKTMVVSMTIMNKSIMNTRTIRKLGRMTRSASSLN